MLTFTDKELEGVCLILRNTHDKPMVQRILKAVQQHNWTRRVLSECEPYLTVRQRQLFKRLGGPYTADELAAAQRIAAINAAIAAQLRAQGVTPFLYENDDYLTAIREGRVHAAGIDPARLSPVE